MAAVGCGSPLEQAPTWRIEEVMACQPRWQLAVHLPMDCPKLDEWDVQLNDAELRLEVRGCPASRWRLSVPNYAQPVRSAKCTLSRRRRSLLVEWPQEAKKDECASTIGSDAKLSGMLDKGPDSLCSAEPAVASAPAVLDTCSTDHALDAAASGTLPMKAESGSFEMEVQRDTDVLAGHAVVEKTSVAFSDTQAADAEQALEDSSATAKIGADAWVEADTSLPAAVGKGFLEDPKECSPGSARCYSCGKVATLCCTRCRVVWYCSRRCQRTHWAADHRTRCPFASKIVCAEKQRHRGDAELALLTLQEAMKAIASALKAEADKEFTHDSGVVAALLRAFSAAAVVMGATIAEEAVPDEKFTQAAFYAASSFMDMAANLSEKEGFPRKRPSELQFHVDNMVAGLEGHLRDDADPVLSAWMFYDQFAKGMSEQMSKYWKKVPKLKVGATIAFRDVLAAGHDLLQASGGDADERAAARADRLLDLKPLKVSTAGLKHLRPYMGHKRTEGGPFWGDSGEGSDSAEET